MDLQGARALPKELIEAEDKFFYINPHVPKIDVMSAWESLVRPGRLIREEGAPGELQFKEFDFGVPFGPTGWNYFYFKVVLQRLEIDGKAIGSMLFDYASSSYGRYTGALPWNYDLILLNGPTPLRKIHLATDFIEECHSPHRASFQTAIPLNPGEIDFPLPFYKAVDNVRLEAYGNQESC